MNRLMKIIKLAKEIKSQYEIQDFRLEQEEDTEQMTTWQCCLAAAKEELEYIEELERTEMNKSWRDYSFWKSERFRLFAKNELKKEDLTKEELKAMQLRKEAFDKGEDTFIERSEKEEEEIKKYLEHVKQIREKQGLSSSCIGAADYDDYLENDCEENSNTQDYLDSNLI